MTVRNALGFTLIEMLVTISVVGVLSAAAGPSFNHLLRRIQLTSAVNSYVSAIQGARSYAVRNNGATYFCPSATGKTCGKGATLSSGWLVTTDPTKDDSVIRYWPATSVVITNNYLDQGYLLFGADGLPRRSNGDPTSGRATFCSSGQGRDVDMGLTGSVRTTETICRP